jgi:acetolactate synthase I/II/III large subunit
MTVSDYIVACLARLGVGTVFGYQGGNISRLIDSLARAPGVRYVQTYNEQGAAFAANGYARSRGDLGVAIASSGPGALNLINGIADAWFDSVPCLFIAGDLSRTCDKRGGPIRQNGFQSTDIVSIVKPITKYAVKVKSVEDFAIHFPRAIAAATFGRPGPALLSLPHWLQNAPIDLPEIDLPSLSPPLSGGRKLTPNMIQALRGARRPLLLVGGGACDAGIRGAVAAFVAKSRLPVVSSLCGLDVIEHDNAAFIGMIGDYGPRCATLAFAAADRVIVLGSRLDERQMNPLNSWLKNKVVIHVDSDADELDYKSGSYIPVHMRIEDFLVEIRDLGLAATGDWLDQLAAWKRHYPTLPDASEKYPHHAIAAISDALPDRTHIFADVGLHQMCVAQSMKLVRGKRLFNSGGLGSMGFALPAAIGSTFATSRMTLCVSGDGGMQMNLQELQTVARERAPVKIIVVNNHSLGMIRDLQMRICEGRFAGSLDGYVPCDFGKLANAFGIPYIKYDTSIDFRRLLLDSGPLLMELDCPADMAVAPPIEEKDVIEELRKAGYREDEA